MNVSAQEIRSELMAHFDADTGLPNRALFLDRLDRAVAQCQRSHDWFALLFARLDGIGHQAEDAPLLKAAGERFAASVRKSDSVSRLGVDTFAVILTHVAEAPDVEIVADKMLAALVPPVDGQARRLEAFIGIGFYPADGQSAEELLARGEAAMREIQRGDRNRWRYWRAV